MVRPVRGGDVSFRDSGPELEPQRRTRPKQPPRPGMGPSQKPKRGKVPPFLERFDRNQDGQVTREEFDGLPRHFSNLDLDGDGSVSKDEAAQAGPPGAKPLRAGGQGSRPGKPPQGFLGRKPGARPGLNRFRPKRPGSNEARPKRPEPSEPMSAADTGEEVRADAAWNELPPSFVFILADDMGWTGTSVQLDDQVPESKSDYYQTPNLQKLAQQGLRFTQAYAPAALCTPTRAAILTGRTPAELHVTTPGGGRSQEPRKLLTPRAPRTKIQDGETTIAEALKEVGYATAHLGKWHLGENSDPGEHGFDVHDGATENHGPGHFEDPNPKDIFRITERAVAFMTEQTKRKKPFYLHLSHYAVHSPTLARQDTVRAFDNLPRGKRHGDAAYAAMTSDLDTSIGTLLAEIEKLGIADNTYVVFMSDNGAPGGPRRRAENLPLAGGKSQLYEGGIRVPFIVRGPGIQAGSFCREAVTGCDLLPTYCELAGASCPENIDGTSMVPLWTGDGAEKKTGGHSAPSPPMRRTSR
jgi:arylsulfatase A-like enzyme